MCKVKLKSVFNTSGTEKTVKNKGIRIYTEFFGKPQDPAILLIMGSDCQGILWPEDFCNHLAKSGFFVIRYDHRDTGLSSSVDFGTDPYDLNDMSRDALNILDEYKIAKAHIVGASMGGFIAQLLAIGYPDRVLSSTLISSSPDPSVRIAAVMGNPIDGYELPPSEPEFLEFFKKEHLKTLTPIEKGIKLWQACNGKGTDFDEEKIRRQETTAYNRVKNNPDRIQGEFNKANHVHAIAKTPKWIDRLQTIEVPTLVIHGDKDPLFPLKHGIFLSQLIKNAKLSVIKDMGHIFPFSKSEYMQELIINHVKSAIL